MSFNNWKNLPLDTQREILSFLPIDNRERSSVAHLVRERETELQAILEEKKALLRTLQTAEQGIITERERQLELVRRLQLRIRQQRFQILQMMRWARVNGHRQAVMDEAFAILGDGVLGGTWAGNFPGGQVHTFFDTLVGYLNDLDPANLEGFDPLWMERLPQLPNPPEQQWVVEPDLDEDSD